MDLMLDDTHYSFCYVELSDDDDCSDFDMQRCEYTECTTHHHDSWTMEELQTFERGLDFCFLNKPKPHIFLSVLQRFVRTKNVQQIEGFTKIYFNSQYHNYSEWTTDEIGALVYGLQRHPNDYVSMKRYIPTRTLFDLHRYVNALLEKKTQRCNKIQNNDHTCDSDFCTHIRLEDNGTVITNDDMHDLAVTLLLVTDDDIVINEFAARSFLMTSV